MLGARPLALQSLASVIKYIGSKRLLVDQIAAIVARLPRVRRVLDLFSGIGGFSLGLERAGMQTVAFCEIDPFCILHL